MPITGSREPERAIGIDVHAELAAIVLRSSYRDRSSEDEVQRGGQRSLFPFLLRQLEEAAACDLAPPAMWVPSRKAVSRGRGYRRGSSLLEASSSCRAVGATHGSVAHEDALNRHRLTGGDLPLLH